MVCSHQSPVTSDLRLLVPSPSFLLSNFLISPQGVKLTFPFVSHTIDMYPWGCTGFDRRFWDINSESGSHLPVKRWKNLNAKRDFALAA